jgi:hypothetical protein
MRTGLNRQRVCMLRNVCLVDMDMIAADEALEQPFDYENVADYHSVFASKRVRLYRPRHMVQVFGDSLQQSTLEQLMYQPLHSQADGEGLVHLHAWENHHGGDPSADKRVLGASPSVSYSQPPPSSAHPHVFERGAQSSAVQGKCRWISSGLTTRACTFSCGTPTPETSGT